VSGGWRVHKHFIFLGATSRKQDEHTWTTEYAVYLEERTLCTRTTALTIPAIASVRRYEWLAPAVCAISVTVSNMFSNSRLSLSCRWYSACSTSPTCTPSMLRMLWDKDVRRWSRRSVGTGGT
jgi:hypothetical protein